MSIFLLVQDVLLHLTQIIVLFSIICVLVRSWFRIISSNPTVGALHDMIAFVILCVGYNNL